MAAGNVIRFDPLRGTCPYAAVLRHHGGVLHERPVDDALDLNLATRVIVGVAVEHVIDLILGIVRDADDLVLRGNNGVVRVVVELNGARQLLVQRHQFLDVGFELVLGGIRRAARPRAVVKDRGLLKAPVIQHPFDIGVQSAEHFTSRLERIFVDLRPCRGRERHLSLTPNGRPRD
jgi:hypothetical protein